MSDIVSGGLPMTLGHILAWSSFWAVATTLGNSWMAGRNFSCRSQMLFAMSSGTGSWDADGIQQGGVRYPTVSHRRTRTLRSSPMRCCVIVDENSVRPVHEMGGCGGDSAARSSRWGSIWRGVDRPRQSRCMTSTCLGAWVLGLHVPATRACRSRRPCTLASMHPTSRRRGSVRNGRRRPCRIKSGGTRVSQIEAIYRPHHAIVIGD
jgi:hypothetical protein